MGVSRSSVGPSTLPDGRTEESATNTHRLTCQPVDSEENYAPPAKVNNTYSLFHYSLGVSRYTLKLKQETFNKQPSYILQSTSHNVTIMLTCVKL